MAQNYLILIPSFNSGSVLLQVLTDACAYDVPIWIVIDGSTDTSPALAYEFAKTHVHVKILSSLVNQGKGAAFLRGAKEALKAGFTHTIVMDADGQHHAADIPKFIKISQANPKAMILGCPIFGPDAPKERVQGRRIGNAFAQLNTLGGNIVDSLYGFRLYPLLPAVEVMSNIKTARRFDFDTELVVRLYWRGIQPINVPTPVSYPKKENGGVTHFRYLRDNLLLAATHTRLFFGMLIQIPKLLRFKWHKVG